MADKYIGIHEKAGTYIAKEDIPKGKLEIVFRGTVRDRCLSKTKVNIMNSVLDGTARSRDFPSAWRVRASKEEGHVNMSVTTLASPSTFCVDNCTGFKLESFQAPVLVNARDVKKGEELMIPDSSPAVTTGTLQLATKMVDKAQPFDG